MAANFLGRGYTALVTLAIVPLLTRVLGPDLYGLLAAAAVIGGLGGLMNLGMGTALCKMASEMAGASEVARIGELFRTAFGIALITGAVAGGLVIAFRHALEAALVHGGTAVQRDAGFALVITGFALALALATEPLSAIPQALQRFDLCALVRGASATVGAAGVVAVLALGFSLRAVLTVQLVAAAVLFLAYLPVVRRLLPGVKLMPKLGRRDLAALLRFSFPVVLAALGAFAVHRLDRLLVAHFLPVAAVAFYAVPYTLAQKATLLSGDVASVVLPSASEISARRDPAQLRELYLRSQKAVILLAVPVTIALAVAAGPILRIYAGSVFARQGSLVLLLLAGGFLLNAMGYIPGVVAQGVGRPAIFAKFSLLNAAVSVALFVILVPRFGISGAGAGFLAAEGVVIPLFLRRVHRLLGVPWRAFGRRALLAPALCGTCMLVPLLAASAAASGTGISCAAAALAISGFGAAAWRFGLDTVERDHVCALMASKLWARSAAGGA
ncbi:MAG: oligosaccharide flippase family protein [Terriglobales bacterium]